MSSTTSTPEVSENVKIELARRAAIKEEMYPKQVNGKAKRRRVRNSGPVRDARAAAAVQTEVSEEHRTEYKINTPNRGQQKQNNTRYDATSATQRLTGPRDDSLFPQPARLQAGRRNQPNTTPHTNQPYNNRELRSPQWADSGATESHAGAASSAIAVSTATSRDGSLAPKPVIVEELDTDYIKREVRKIDAEKDEARIADDGKIGKDEVKASITAEEKSVEENVDEGKVEKDILEGEQVEGAAAEPKAQALHEERPISQPQVTLVEYEDLHRQRPTFEAERHGLYTRCSTAEETLVEQQQQLQHLQSQKKTLQDRLAAVIAVDQMNQDQLVEDAKIIQNLELGIAAVQKENENVTNRLSDYQGMQRQRDGLNHQLMIERADSQATFRMFQNQIAGLGQEVSQAKARHAGCDGRIKALEGDLERARERLASLQLAHDVVKDKLTEALHWEEAQYSELKDKQDRLDVATSRAAGFETQVGDLKAACGKHEATEQELKALLEEKDRLLEEKDRLLEEKDRLLEEKDRLVAEKDRLVAEKDRKLAELLSQRLAKERKKSRQARNRRFEAEKEQENHKLTSQTLVVFGPRRCPAQHVSKKFRAGIIKACLAQMGADNLIFHDINRIRFFPDWHGLIHHSAPKLTTKAAPHSITSPPDTETGSKPQLNIKTATIKPTKSISKSVTEWLKFIAMAFLYGLGILMFYAYILPGPVFPNGGSTNPKFVSAAPSCEVFNSAISIVETTCSWEPPKPSALILAASSTLTGPNPNPAESELFWTDTAQLCGNCSTADGSSHERDADRDACDDMRQHSERKTAIRIAVTVVVPCVVFGAFHWSVGYF